MHISVCVFLYALIAHHATPESRRNSSKERIARSSEGSTFAARASLACKRKEEEEQKRKIERGSKYEERKSNTIKVGEGGGGYEDL